jgi:CheY-like chemotaxis protein
MKTILYLEDDEHDIFFLKRALATQAPDIGFHHVTNPGDAQAFLEGNGRYGERNRFPFPDLIVSDVSIPGGSGFQFVNWIRNHSEFSALPVILLTGSAQESQIEKGLSSGANYCLEKSADLTCVLDKMRELLYAGEKH